MTTRRSTSFRVRATLAAVASALALFIAELTLRVAASVGARGTLRALHEPRPDRAWLYGLRPGADERLEATGAVRYRINADGFRDPLRSRQAAPGTRRLVVLGDSLTFGYGVEQNDAFPARLERLLSRPGAPAEVLNLGVNGYNPYNEARLLEEVARTYTPTLVLAQFCVNDLHDPTLHFDVQTRDRLIAIPDAAFPDPSVRRPRPGTAQRLCRTSRLCALLEDRIGASLRSESPEQALLALLAPPERLRQRDREWLRARWGEMAAEAERIGARFAIVVFPYREQIASQSAAQLQQDLADLGRMAGWPVIDLLPAFRSTFTGGERSLFLDAWHPSAEGHRVAAEVIASRLGELQLLPPGAIQGGADSTPGSLADTSAGP
jgi:lysophospholipase L1-like esterase